VVISGFINNNQPGVYELCLSIIYLVGLVCLRKRPGIRCTRRSRGSIYTVNEGFDMRRKTRCLLALLLSALMVALPALAYDYPLSASAIRDA
jgi:hypothetical protein